jgi:hypothetical protein
MARLPLSTYYQDPDEEERRALLEQEFGPPVAYPNLGVMSKEEITAADIEAARARADEPWPESPRPPGGTDYVEPELVQRQEASALDELLLPRTVATNPYEDEPDPQDVAADTVDERETPPARGIRESADENAAGLSPGKLSLSFDPVEELSRLRQEGPRDWRNVADVTMNEGGPNPDLMGYKHPLSERDTASARAAELYGEATPTSRWEDDFLANHERAPDSDIRMRSAIATLLGGPEEGRRFSDHERKLSEGYEKSLYEARERDRSEQRVSKGLAQAIAASDLGISPEEAVQLRMNDPIVKAFQNGGYSQGLRGEGQQMGLTKKVWDINAGAATAEMRDKGMTERGLMNNANQLQIAQTYANARSKLPDPADPVAQAKELELQGSVLARSMQGISKEQGMRIVQGDLSGLTPEQKDHVGKFLPGMLAGLGNQRTRDSIIRGFTTFETQKEAKRENAVRQSIELARNDLAKAEKWEHSWKASAIPLSMAMQSWGEMSEDSKAAFAQWSTQGFAGAVNKFLTDPGDQQRAAKVRRVINALVKDRSGSAVTGSEWERIATEIGLPEGSWAPFNSSDTITQHLQDSASLLDAHRADYETILGGWKGN